MMKQYCLAFSKYTIRLVLGEKPQISTTSKKVNGFSEDIFDAETTFIKYC